MDAALLFRLREATPGWGQALHLNHGGASLMPRAAHEALRAHLELEARMGAMDAGIAAAAALASVRANAARLIGAEPDEIAFAGSGSAAFGALFAALFPPSNPLRAGDRILVGRHEWGGNVATYERAAARAGATVEAIPCRADGAVDADALAALLDARVRLVSLTWLPANGGLINDAAAIGRATRAAGVPYLIDAGQALGQLPVDVRELGCDMLKSAGRKHLRGPRGTALIYVRRGFIERLDPPWVDVRSAECNDARRLETSELPVALWLALGKSLELALELGSGTIAARVQGLAALARERLAAVPGLALHDLGDGPRSSLVSFTVEGVDPMALKARLAERRIHIGANGVPYTPLDMRARGLDAVARLSFSYLNDEGDVEAAARAIESAAETA